MVNKKSRKLILVRSVKDRIPNKRDARPPNAECTIGQRIFSTSTKWCHQFRERPQNTVGVSCPAGACISLGGDCELGGREADDYQPYGSWRGGDRNLQRNIAVVQVAEQTCLQFPKRRVDKYWCCRNLKNERLTSSSTGIFNR